VRATRVPAVTGLASAGWTSTGIIRSPRSSWCGIGTTLRRILLGQGHACAFQGFPPTIASPRDIHRVLSRDADEHAQFEDGSVSVQAGLMDMLDRMQSGRFKVFKHLHNWFEEFRLFHRKDGRVVKEGDDILAASRYALMMLRFARMIAPSKPRRRRPHRCHWQAA
jgi:hypothetical protein